MKKLIFLMLCITLLSFTFIPVVSTNNAIISIETDESIPIDLEGDLQQGGFRSGTDPIVVEQEGNALFIRFQKEVGVLQVTITGAQGTVYTTSVDTATQSALTIPLAGMPAGNYTILFANEYGMMWREFTL